MCRHTRRGCPSGDEGRFIARWTGLGKRLRGVTKLFDGGTRFFFELPVEPRVQG